VRLGRVRDRPFLGRPAGGYGGRRCLVGSRQMDVIEIEGIMETFAAIVVAAVVVLFVVLGILMVALLIGFILSFL
jgi:hypothetical protein